MEFNEKMVRRQLAWRKKNIGDQRYGTQRGQSRSWILPPELWEEGLWPGIRGTSAHSLPAYLSKEKIEKDKAVHNLRSSWAQCANLYFPFQRDRAMLAGFLKQHVSSRVESVEAVELEYAAPPPLDPQTLLGEPAGGQPGANQTSPDVAFIVRTAKGRGLILAENKLVEHSFYGCSGRKPEVHNPNAKRCLNFGRLYDDLPHQCYQLQWEQGARKNRKYWDHLRISARGRKVLRQCPAATAGYQLFRQQALAEGIAAAGKYDLVASCVAYDERNSALIRCLRPAGIGDFRTGWAPLFDGKALFAAFSHQEWVAWVKDHDRKGRWADWLLYVSGRYGY